MAFEFQNLVVNLLESRAAGELVTRRRCPLPADGLCGVAAAPAAKGGGCDEAAALRRAVHEYSALVPKGAS